LLEFIARFSANASKSKQATSRKKALEKLTIEEIEPSNRRYPGIIFKQLREVGNQILNVEKLAKKAENGRYLFSNVNFSVNKGDKIAFVSKDHLALTTFFKIINGEMAADGGKFEWGTTVTKAYLPNDNTEYFEGEQINLMDWLRQFVPPHVTDVDEPFLRGFLLVRSGRGVVRRHTVPQGRAGPPPARPAHVHPHGQAGRTQRRPLFQVMLERHGLVALGRGPVRVDHPPPRGRTAVAGQHPADLARAAGPQVLGDVAVGHHLARGNRVHHVKDARGIVVDRGHVSVPRATRGS